MTPSAVRMLVLVAGVFLCQSALAQNAYRDQRWEFTLQMLGLEGKDYAFEGGSSASTKDSFGFGFGAAYNVNPHLNIGGEFYWANMDYDANIRDAGALAYTSRGSMDIWSFMLNATWNILAGPLTPYLQGGFGSVTVDSNIANGPPVNSCWYYPYYGYYCGTFVPTATSTSFAYNAGGGIRWDFSREAFMKFGVQRQWIDFDGATSSYSGMNVWRLEFGFKN